MISNPSNARNYEDGGAPKLGKAPQTELSTEVSTPLAKHSWRHGALFAGIGGFCTAFNARGFKPVFANELDKSVIDTHRKNQDVELLLDSSIKEISADQLPEVDVVHGGFPCQSFSPAGERAGFDDARGQLFFEIPRLLNEYGSRRPKVLILENSPYLLVGQDGAWIRKIIHELNKAGYWFDISNAVILDVARHAGIPQSRQRLFIVALDSEHFNGNFIRQSDFKETKLRPLSEFISPQDEIGDDYYLPKNNKYETLILQHQIDDPYQIYQLRKFYVRLAPKGLCPTLTANMGGGGHNVPFVIANGRVRKLTEYECLRLQGFPDSFLFPEQMPMGRRYQMIGNAVCPIIAGLLADKVTVMLESINV